LLPFRSLDPFRALREPDRRRRDEERLSRSEQRTANKTKNNHLTGKAPYKFESWTAACMLRKRWAERADLNCCNLRSRRRTAIAEPVAVARCGRLQREHEDLGPRTARRERNAKLATSGTGENPHAKTYIFEEDLATQA
jgi:hypothetical protein